MSDMWGNITEGMKVEIPNTDIDLPAKVYWIASVVKIAGKKCSLNRTAMFKCMTSLVWFIANKLLQFQ